MTQRVINQINVQALTRLPWVCANRHPLTREPVLHVRGEDGYIPAKNIILDPDQFNKVLGIDAFQATAMEAGAMFGWTIPGCDPQIYRDRGLIPMLHSFTEIQVPVAEKYEPMDPKSIADQIVTAFEGGSSWIGGAHSLSPKDNLEKPWYSDPRYYQDDWQIEITTNDDEPVVEILNSEKYGKGLILLHNEHSQHWDDLISENGDAITADVLIQLALFGEVVYA